MPQISLICLFFLAAFNAFNQLNAEKIHATASLISGNTYHAEYVKYQFNKEALVEMAEMLIHVTLFDKFEELVQKNPPKNSQKVDVDPKFFEYEEDLEGLRQTLVAKSKLPSSNRGLLKIIAFFENFIKKETDLKHSFPILARNLWKEFDYFCDADTKYPKKSHPEEHASYQNICKYAAEWLQIKIENYLNANTFLLETYDNEHKKQARNEKWCGLKCFGSPPKPENKKADAVLEENRKKTTYALAKQLYRDIYKHALGFLLISEALIPYKQPFQYQVQCAPF